MMLSVIWQGALLPLGVALAVLVACRALRAGAVGSVLALAAGLLASYFAALHAQWSPVPKVALDWLPWIVAVAAAAVPALEKLPGVAARIVARSAIGLVAGALVVLPAIGSFGVQKAALAAIAVGLLIALVWSLMARDGEGRATRPLLLALVAGGGGLALMLDSSQSVGQLSGALAAALAACVVFSMPRLRVPFGTAATGLAVLLLGTLLANAHLYAGFPLGYVALLVAALLAAPVLSAIGDLRRKGEGAPSWVAAAVLTAIPVAVTVGLAVKAAQDSGGY
jgi:hypothetical protein